MQTTPSFSAWGRGYYKEKSSSMQMHYPWCIGTCKCGQHCYASVWSFERCILHQYFHYRCMHTKFVTTQTCIVRLKHNLVHDIYCLQSGYSLHVLCQYLRRVEQQQWCNMKYYDWYQAYSCWYICTLGGSYRLSQYILCTLIIITGTLPLVMKELPDIKTYCQ